MRTSNWIPYLLSYRINNHEYILVRDAIALNNQIQFDYYNILFSIKTSNY